MEIMSKDLDYYYVIKPILNCVFGDIVLLTSEEAELLKDYVQHYPEYKEVLKRKETGDVKFSRRFKKY